MRPLLFAARSNRILPLATLCTLSLRWINTNAFQHIRLRPWSIVDTVTRYIPTQQQSYRNRLNRVLGLTVQYVHSIREADCIEQMVGGVRYENVPMPMSMKATTLFVSNLCEFAHDDDLSQLFQKVSKLQSVPACVVRKADTTSLQYGFVAFPTVEEKEVGSICKNQIGSLVVLEI
jgi:RNA recognition motif. (a.k.a. RRM, RBD, or RNP domain)